MKLGQRLCLVSIRFFRLWITYNLDLLSISLNFKFSSTSPVIQIYLGVILAIGAVTWPTLHIAFFEQHVFYATLPLDVYVAGVLASTHDKANWSC